MRVTGVDWTLDVHYREKTYRGKVSIGIEGAADPLVVDSGHLGIDSTALDGRPIAYREDPEKETLQFSGVSPDSQRLEIAYHGAADSKSLLGLYISPAGPEYVLTTQMFPFGSRRVLPCFEHPAIKAVYRLTLTTDADVKAIFNTAPRSRRVLDGRQELTFAPTPPMSAYLLYIGIGPFDILTLPRDRWEIRFAASPGRAGAGRYTAEHAGVFLAGFEEYYGTPYPLSKLDLVTIEKCLESGMENWGAIVLLPEILLVDPTTSVLVRRRNLVVLAHEIAHQWFGNLVTPAWWDDFWLNESFATFVAYKMVGQKYPSDDPWTGFFTRFVRRAFDMDSLSFTHSVRERVDSPADIGRHVSYVTYGKGASVLRMIESYLGEEAFRQGVSRYLAEHRFGNARTEDLWAALGEASGRPVEKIMTDWVTRPGHPVLHAHWADGRLTLRQERFRFDGAPSPETWPIPLRIRTSQGETVEFLDGPELSLPLASVEGLQINPGRTVFGRIHYDATLIDRMMGEFPSMAPIDQWGFVLDAHAFVYAELIPIGRFLEISRAGSSVENDLPVLGLNDALLDLRRALYDLPVFASTAQSFLRAHTERIGLEAGPNEPEGRAPLRESITAHRAIADIEFSHELAPRFSEFDHQPPALRQAIAIAYARVGGSAAFESILTRLKTTTLEGEKVQMRVALTKCEDPALIRRSLDLVLGALVTGGAAPSFLVGVSLNPAGRGLLFDWYRDHRKVLSDMWSGTRLHDSLLQYAMPGMGMDREERVTRYFTDNPPADATQGVPLGLEDLRLSMRLRRSALGLGRD